MIRIVTGPELETLLPVAAEFHRRMSLPGTFDGQSFMKTWTALINAGIGFVMARFAGDEPLEAIGMVVSGDVFTGDKSAVSTFWMYSERANGLSGGLLYSRVEQECATRGARKIMVSVLYSSPHIAESIKFLTRAGYELTENTFRKAI